MRMRIAFVSYEMASVAGGGGIGTYVSNAAAMLSSRGHTVEIFAANQRKEGAETFGGVTVSWVNSSRGRFASDVADVFLARHEANPFEVVESAEFGGDAAIVFANHPEVARVVRLHTPSFLVDEINLSTLPLRQKARFVLGALRRGHWRRPFPQYDPRGDKERLIAASADEIVAPTRAVLELVRKRWRLPASVTACVPNAFAGSESLLQVSPETSSQRATFLGRLEARKGVLDLLDAIPIVLSELRTATVRFVGRSQLHPALGGDFREHAISRLRQYGSAVEFLEEVPNSRIPSLLGETDVCVFPSLWENAPYACLESMAAARGVIGSGAGGMAEMISHGVNGLLVPPRNPRAIATAMLELLCNPRRRIAMGLAARAHVVTNYSRDAIGPYQEASYLRAIHRARSRLRGRTTS